jgi:3-oxoacyl-[acyl-carrier protein] reductase
MTTPNSRRTTLITGASRGLGAAIALEQGAVGSNVAIKSFASLCDELSIHASSRPGSTTVFKAMKQFLFATFRIESNFFSTRIVGQLIR